MSALVAETRSALQVMERTAENPIIILKCPARGESGCASEVSDETMDLLLRIAERTEPLSFAPRSYGGLTKQELTQVTDYEARLIMDAFHASGSNRDVGLQLVVVAAFRFGHKFKPLAPLATVLEKRHPGDKVKVLAIINKATNAQDPYYTGPRTP